MTSHCGLCFNPIFLLYHNNFPRSRSIPPTSPCASHYRNAILLPSHKACTQRYCRDSRKSYFSPLRKTSTPSLGRLKPDSPIPPRPQGLHTVIEPLETPIHFFSPRTGLTHIQVALSKTFVSSLIKISVRPCAVFLRKGGHYRFFCISVILLLELNSL